VSISRRSSGFACDPAAPLVEMVAHARGKWIWEVLELTPEQLGLELVGLQFRLELKERLGKAGAIPAIDLGG
jgi:hypothetical protein